MAKRKPKRTRLAKPKFIEVDGHQLTEAMDGQFKSRVVLSPHETERARHLALDEILSDHRPSSKMSARIADITDQAISSSLALATMRKYLWHGTGAVRKEGCELVRKLALDLYYASAKLTAIAAHLRTEEITKLQDWVAQDEQLAQIGKGAEVSHARN